MTAVWEPITFGVGDRVRVLARPECFYCREDHDAEVGETGVVEFVGSRHGSPDHHPIWVEFDDPDIVTRTASGTDCSHFAAIELELTERSEPWTS